MALFKLHGVKVPHRKNTEAYAPVRMPTPESVTIPLSMHIGAPAKAVVKVGEKVKTGQLIAEASGFVSSPIYASITGTVKKLDPIVSPNGALTAAITIAADETQVISETCVKPDVHDYDSFIEAVKASGVVGLGGAGFPTFVKLSVKELSKVKHIVINGAECEPYITSDTQTMLHDADNMFEGIRLLEKYMNASSIIIGIENNKPQCIKKMEEMAAGDSKVSVKALPAMYPQGGEKVLIYNTTGGIVPEGGLPIDAGAVVLNCTTLAAIAKYVNTGIPLVEKCITVDGGAVKEPKNVIVPIGTAMSSIFDFCGGLTASPKKVLYGGPMMGIAVADTAAPVLKNTNAILALTDNECKMSQPTACLRCGSCVSHCPMRLIPCEIERAFTRKDTAGLNKFKVGLCMECGCCSFICPASRPLVQTNKLAKAYLKAEAEKEKMRGESK